MTSFDVFWTFMVKWHANRFSTLRKLVRFIYFIFNFILRTTYAA